MRALRIKTARGVLDLRQFVGTLAYFSGMLRAHAWVLSIAAVATTAATLMALAAPWPVKVVLDQIILGHPAKGWLEHALNWLGWHENLLVVCAAAVVVIAVLQGLFEYASELLQASTAHRISNTLRRRLFKHLQTLSLGFHERNRTGDLLLRLTGDITMVRELLVESMFDLAAAALTVAGLLIVMARMAPTLTLVSLMTIPAVALLSMVMSIRLRSVVRKAREKEGDLISIAGEVLSSMALVQAFTREEAEKERFSRLGRSALRAGLKSVRIQSRLNRSVQFVTAVGTCAILYFGVQEVTAGRMTPGTLIVFMAYFNSLLKPIRQVARIAAKIAKASSCADRVRSVLDTEPEIRDRADAVPAPAFTGRITYDNLAFGYARGTKTLSDIYLDILPGQRVALVGPTGAGKSTLLKLLLRFYDPTSGAVRIDGRDIREFTLESLRRQISVVQQETILFGTTIEENIAMGRAGATLDDVRAAAAALDLDDWLSSLPKGYKTPVGERGITLSGGQRQLIALARAILRGGRILIFDEPTTGLDGQTEMRIRAALRRAMRDRTTILISHGARPLADVDRIVVMSEGRIVQSGQAQDLVQTAGVYRDLFGMDEEQPRMGSATR
ncbi:hypothetical protein B7486_34275 [cyanobacterium TDX16]|nr:hypothetical protein B7486_34275 [cyanobacterium TDX16]